MVIEFQKKRIVIGTSSLPPAAGIASFVDDLAMSLSNDFHSDVMVLAPYTTAGIVRPYQIKEFPIYSQPAEERGIMLDLYHEVNRFRPDIIINNDNAYLAGLMPAFPSIKYSIVHYPQSPLQEVACYYYDYFDWIITLCQLHQKILIKKRLIDPIYCRTVFSGVYVPSSNKKMNKRTDNLNLIFAGGNSIRKGAKHIVKLATHILNNPHLPVNLHWVGHGAKTYSNSLLRGDPRIMIYDYVDRSSFRLMLQSMDIVLLPSKLEALPMVFLEAMAEGLIPIVSECESAMREIIGLYHNGFVLNEKNWGCITNVIEMFLKDKFLLETLSKKNLYLSESEFNMKHFVRRLSLLGPNSFKKLPMQLNKLKVIKWHRVGYKYPKRSFRGLFQRAASKLSLKKLQTYDFLTSP